MFVPNEGLIHIYKYNIIYYSYTIIHMCQNIIVRKKKIIAVTCVKYYYLTPVVDNIFINDGYNLRICLINFLSILTYGNIKIFMLKNKDLNLCLSHL